MSLYLVGTLLFPMGDFSAMQDLSKMYEQCKAEDPDIDAADFVFEHLLNLESVLDHFDKDDATEKNERPHQPFQTHATHIVIVISKPIQLIHKQPFFLIEEIKHNLHQDRQVPNAYLSEVFHPPIV
ncbi:MAG: hypothetical protein JSS82_11190 [Bacteroidetes bacterium]|nr:hypothetical protein [Bacteroidota bacterium]